jgi:hypothetical protein
MPEPDETEPVGADLQPKHHKAIAALLDQPSITKAAVAAGISHATIHRWLQDPTFHRAYMHAPMEDCPAIHRPGSELLI